MAVAIKNIESLKEFQNEISKPTLTVFHFWADWADQCGPMNDAMSVLSRDDDGVKYYKVEAETVNDVSLAYEITAVPTFLIFKDGVLLRRIDGAKPAELASTVKELLNAKKSTMTVLEPKESEVDLNSRLKSLINSSKVILFMKGNKTDPKCGFSRTAVSILEDLNADYVTFDILKDDTIRQGLKKYSNWPTYPQLYIDGELFGGVDIMKESKDDLAKKVPIKEDLNTRLKNLINSSPLMVFMKGDRDEPKCGFSRQLMEILKETKVQFKTFDILNDERVRQGLKEYSKWPTYPQVYVKGELIGGLDIIKELKDSGELNDTLKV